MTNELNPKYIIADHIRAACFIIVDGVEPSGKQRGYILRRLIRRSLSASLKLQIDISNNDYFTELVDAVINIYKGVYDELGEHREKLIQVLTVEAQKYLKAITTGQKQWKKILASEVLDNFELSKKTWDLYQTFGVPMEVSEDVLSESNLSFDRQTLENLIAEHQKLSQTTSAGQFKSGVSGDSLQMKKLHTVTHILHMVLRRIYGDSVNQKGSAITDEKARFDITLEQKLEPADLVNIEKQVQDIIDQNLVMVKTEMSEKQARDLGAIGLFGEKYGDQVSVYTLQNVEGVAVSREFCGGPHISNTNQIGTFSILKQKSIGQGLKRLEFTVS
jgi:alanyl-tRNA synthetase